MKEKHLEIQPRVKPSKQEETRNCNFIPELNSIDFFSRLNVDSPPSQSELFTQMNINRTIWV